MIIHLPVHVAGEFFGEWLDLRSLVRLDSAFCNSTLRPRFLEILASPYCILTSRVYSFSAGPSSWLMNRRLKLSNIWLYYSQEETRLCTYLERFGEYVHVLKCFHGVQLPTVAPNLRNLTSLMLSDSTATHTVYNILKCNPFLEEVRLERMSVLDGAQLEHLELKKVTLLSLCSSFWKDECVSSFAKACAHLTRVDLKRCYSLSTTELFTFAEHCPIVKSLGLQHLQFCDATLAQLTSMCPHIMNLDIRENASVTDRGLQKIARNLTSLRSLNIAYCYRLTDLSLLYLAENRANTLEVLRMNGFISAHIGVLCTFLRKCTKLHTFSTGLQLTAHISVIPYMHHLKSLIIWSLVTDKILTDIARHCTQLETLNLSYTLTEGHNVTQFGAPLSTTGYTDVLYAATARSAQGQIPYTEKGLIALRENLPHLTLLGMEVGKAWDVIKEWQHGCPRLRVVSQIGPYEVLHQKI